MFGLIINNFSIKYLGERHAHHLLQALQEYYTITTDWEGKKFAIVDLDWTYATKHSHIKCRLSMKGYIEKPFLK